MLIDLFWTWIPRLGRQASATSTPRATVQAWRLI